MLQPCDQGIIRNLKVHYRHILLQKMFVAIDDNELFSIYVLDALRILHTAWDKVTKQTLPTASIMQASQIRIVFQQILHAHHLIQSQWPWSVHKAVTSSLSVGMHFTDFVSVDDDVVTKELMFSHLHQQLQMLK